MKSYVQILTSIDIDFQRSLANFRVDPIFQSDQTTYTDDDKRRISLLWWDIIEPFLKLRKILRSLLWRSFFIFGSKDSFVVKYAVVTTYYNILYELQESFGPHEEFIRQYLDDSFRENYSTLARYMYHPRFYTILSYPHEFFLTLHDEADPSLLPLFDRPQKYAWEIEKRWRHDLANISYYIRYRIGTALTWIVKYGWNIMARIHLKKREKWLIASENIREILTKTLPWDILLTRQNWVATNLSIPGFWKHMSMYVWIGSDIKKQYSASNTQYLIDDTHYIIEAIGTWVRIVPIEILLSHNDYLWVVRPSFSPEKKSRAIRKVLALLWKEYDYSFNYYSDANYVCSTLVTKAYLPDSDRDEGIHITLTRIGTGITYPPNDLVKKYRSEYGSESQELEFVGFIDSREKNEENFLASEAEFCLSWDRPRLSFLLP
jgi:uncharacterized protein YycO